MNLQFYDELTIYILPQLISGYDTSLTSDIS